ncbi:putative glycine cleavage system t protein [Neofusicoccum parvum]|uniref:Glycine cleavage system t protein n=1 Tax=Neofusicoccum parvum TaxID=310453 RepID=A0ACB5RXV4_9PEZI|nr:putative glycine cleavage system t protein [Neofusicoccum parvum]GME66224.1 putative glycine cleavage system t protein [Neofusicoccum parvum]
MAARRGAALFAPRANGLVRPRALSILGRAQQLSTSRCHPRSVNNSPIALPARALPSAALAQSFSSVRQYSSEASLEKTPLYDLHASYGAKFVPFGGFAMPVQYSDLSVGESHNWTREKASLFDVSHMVQHYFKGPGAAAFLERITPASASTLADNSSTLSTLLHRNTGGIVDDTIITKLPGDVFFVVTNAACRDKDSAYLSGELDAFKAEHGEDGTTAVTWDRLDGRGLIALQGPLAVDILSSVLPAESRDLTTLYFGQSRSLSFQLPNGQAVSDVLVSRGGYTGEDGFEISVPGEHTTALAQLLLETGGPDKLRWAGLGARDSLRLEAGMCLYGHDLDDTTTPVEGALAWIIPKDRREKGGFHGSDVVLAQLKPKSKGGAGVGRRRIGLVVEGAPAREGAEIVDETGASIGKITSGCPSPTLKKNIAMGYIKDGKHKSGTEVQVVVRGKPRKAVVTKMPFVPSKYWKGGATPG